MHMHKSVFFYCGYELNQRGDRYKCFFVNEVHFCSLSIRHLTHMHGTESPVMRRFTEWHAAVIAKNDKERLSKTTCALWVWFVTSVTCCLICAKAVLRFF